MPQRDSCRLPLINPNPNPATQTQIVDTVNKLVDVLPPPAAASASAAPPGGRGASGIVARGAAQPSPQRG